jgi:F-type H+-transporting ATPase subunit delta
MSVTATRYARALMDVLYPEKAAAGFEQLERFAALLNEQPEARRLLENPTIPADRRKALVKEIRDALGFDRRVSNFIAILIDKNRLQLLNEIIDAYRKQLDDRLGIARAVVTAAHPLDSVQQKELALKLEALTGKQVHMEMAVDRSLIGGVIARVGGTIYDGSVRTQLEALRSRLTE